MYKPKIMTEMKVQELEDLKSGGGLIMSERGAKSRRGESERERANEPGSV
jgi:hypothetical protein